MHGVAPPDAATPRAPLTHLRIGQATCMFSRFFIERPVLANVLALVIVLIGAVALYAAARRAISERHAADRRRCTTRYPGASAKTVDGHRRAAHRAAGQRRRGHDLHAVDQRQRRHLYAQRHIRDRHRPEQAQVLVQNRVAAAMAQLPQAVQVQGVTTQKTVDRRS